MIQTKSLDRLERLQQRLKIRGKIVFSPSAVEDYRYALFVPASIPTPLGKNAQAARFALAHMNGSRP